MFRRNRNRSYGKNSAVTYTGCEPYSICYYLYCLCENRNNNDLLTDPDPINMFFFCAEKLKLEDRLKAILEKEIINLEKLNLLKLLPEDSKTERDCFDYCSIPYKYEQDKMVDRELRNYDRSSDFLINFVRVLLLNEKPVFSKLINSVVFSTDPDCSLNAPFKLSKKVKKAIFDISKTRFLVDDLNMSEDEARYILLTCRFETIPYLRNIKCSFDSEYYSQLPKMLDISKKELSCLLKNEGKIKTFGFIDSDGDYNESLIECIEASSIEPYFNDVLKVYNTLDAYNLDTFSVQEESLEVCTNLLNGNNPVSILFYGKPGSGKTELAKALCKKTGNKVYVFKNEAESSGNDGQILGRLVCLLSMERKDSVLIVDEADTLLKTIDNGFFGAVPSKTKGTVNKMLENNRDKVIYIINHTSQLDESTLRRFTFSIKFESMSPSQLRSIAKTKIEPLGLSENVNTQIVSMLDKYHLTGQSVENIVKTIEGMECRDEENLLKTVQVVMKENSLLLNGQAKMRESVKAEYDPTVLNASTSPLEIVEMVQNAEEFAEKNRGCENGIRILFYGLSGTGKTELARYISEKLGKSLLLKRASDILGMYVGQNEKNIRDAFTEAENTNSILLFDEADSFFSDRKTAKNSWERTLVNEFLTQMEEFSGILICTTNLRKIMDPAMERRFHIMVEFKPMTYDGIKTMSEKYFTSWPFTKSQLEELDDCQSVTPGDFGSLSSRIRFMKRDSITSDYIFSELMKLQEEKKANWDLEELGCHRRIGFGA